MSLVTNAIRKLKRGLTSEHLFSRDDLAELYTRELPSFASQLPYAGYDTHTGTFILEDNISRAICLTISPIPTEGLSGETLAQYRDSIAQCYEMLEERPLTDGPWVIQEFTYEDNSIEALMENMRAYVKEPAQGHPFTENYLAMMENHYRDLSKDGGLFVDEEVTGEPWRLRMPRTKLILYRRQSDSDVAKIKRNRHDPAREINNYIKDFEDRLTRSGVRVHRDSPDELFQWLFSFFNVAPELNGFSSKQEYMEYLSHIDCDMVVGTELCEKLLVDTPKSSVEDNCWYFNKHPRRFLRLGGLIRPPRIGQLTGEVTSGVAKQSSTLCALDSFPEGTVLSKTLVIVPQSDFETQMNKVEKNSYGDNEAARKSARLLHSIDARLEDSDNKLLMALGVYITGNDLDELEANQRAAITTLNKNNIQVYKDDIDRLGLRSFITHLPMNFRPEADKKKYYQRSTWTQHAANLSFAFGRSEGTGNPCISMFNRGGAPLFIDPYNKRDKSNNSFGFVVGAPGSGKSVTLTYIAYSIMAMYRPRLFIIEYGGSFSLAAKDFAKKGLTVNEVTIMPESLPSLAPFADIQLILEQEDALTEQELIDNFKDPSEKSENGEDDEEEDSDDLANKKRDTLGELDQILLLMVTGSEERELQQYSRADRSLMRRSLLETAKRLKMEGEKVGNPPKQCIVSDIKKTMELMSRSTDSDFYITDKQRDKLINMAQALDAYTTGIAGRLFNQEGDNWPDADVTILNLGVLSQESNEALLNITFASLMQRINNLSEAFQDDPRDIVSIIDEAHLELKNPMTCRALVKQVKTSRKLGAWPMFATQNVGDLSGEAAKILSMIEWFYCLNVTDDEIQKISKFKEIDGETVTLMRSTRKQNGAYTEGVILGNRSVNLFRAVIPSLIIALAMTESAEKAERRKLVREMNLGSDLEGAYEIACRINKSRGINRREEFGAIAA